MARAAAPWTCLPAEGSVAIAAGEGLARMLFSRWAGVSHQMYFEGGGAPIAG